MVYELYEEEKTGNKTEKKTEDKSIGGRGVRNGKERGKREQEGERNEYETLKEGAREMGCR